MLIGCDWAIKTVHLRRVHENLFMTLRSEVRHPWNGIFTNQYAKRIISVINLLHTIIHEKVYLRIIFVYITHYYHIYTLQCIIFKIFLEEIPEEEDSGEEEGEEDMEGEGETDDQGGDGSLLTTPHHGKTRRR